MVADKLADRGKAPWRMALTLVAVTAGAAFVTWTGDARPSRTRCRCSHAGGWVHVKVARQHVTKFQAVDELRFAMAATSTHVDTIVELFDQLEHDTRDERARWVRIHADDPDALVAELGRDPAIEQAFVEPVVSLPHELEETRYPSELSDREALALIGRPIEGELAPRLAVEDPSCPITTPSFESYQGYLGPAPHGIDAPAAWRRGTRGQGIWFADVEGGWNAKHEDLPGDRITHVVGREINDPSWRAHGTAVLGEVVGRDNGKGVVGIAPDVERVFTGSIGGTSPANAIDTAARKLRPGDVLLIELQTTGPRGRYLPMEWYDDVYDAIRAATDRGVVIIEAAGNGNEDLDHDTYKRKFDRTKRDSGAIMIGAGGPPRDGFRDREKLDFSNYGSRVDVQGWGRMVATLDYGDLQSCEDDDQDWRYTDRHYTNQFSGTSSASPIVAGAAVLVESFAKQRGKVIAPRALRDLLARTGTPQAGDTRKHIGPRPNLARALQAVP